MKRVVLGLSGGVDSTLSAGLLRERGYQVTGAYLYSGDDISREKARRSAEELGIDFVSVDIRDEMENKICSAFVREFDDFHSVSRRAGLRNSYDKRIFQTELAVIRGHN